LIDWADIGANRFQAGRGNELKRPTGPGRNRQVIVCCVNGIATSVIEAKRPLSPTKPTAMVDEGISQHLRNRQGDGIQTLCCCSRVRASRTTMAPPAWPRSFGPAGARNN
jgi:type I restriction enzyme R subunit